MKKIVKVLAFFLAAVSFAACTKQENPVAENSQPKEILTAEEKSALVESVRTYYQLHKGEQKSNGAEFIVPFFTIEAWGFAKIDDAAGTFEAVYFVAELDEQDFYMLNPYGTVSVHINTQDAEAYYFPNLYDEFAPMYYGSNGHYNSNYSGPVIDFGNGFQIIDTQNLQNASVHGNCQVSATGTAPFSKLKLRFIVNPGGVNETEFSIR